VGFNNNLILNSVSSYIGPLTTYGMIACGCSNHMEVADYAVIFGGMELTNNANFGYIMGKDGYIPSADSYSFLYSGDGSHHEIIKQSEFVIYASNGVSINTNDPGTNALRVAGNVDAPSFSINGTDITARIVNPTNGITADTCTNIVQSLISSSGSTNAISNLNGSGTNTTIGFMMTNYSGTPITLVGTNSFFAGTNVFIQDGNSNDFLYFQMGNYGGTFYAELLWTNTAGSGGTNSAIAFNGHWRGSSTGTNYFPVYKLTTNIVSFVQPFFGVSPTPDGAWFANYGATGTVTGKMTVTSTNYTFVPTMINGRLNPLTYTWPLLTGSVMPSTFQFFHGLGTEPASSKWDLVCVYNDAASGYAAGDALDLNRAINSGDYYELTANSQYSVMSCAFNDWGAAVLLIVKGGGGTFVYPTCVTNFVLRVRVQP